MKYELVIFDLDGTVMDSSRALINTCHEVQRKMDLPPLDEKILVKCIGRNIVESIRENYGADESVAMEFARNFFDCYPKHIDDVDLFKGIVDVVKTIGDDAIVAIATNNSRNGTENLLKVFGIRDLFDHVRGVIDSNGPTKAEMITDLMRTTGVSQDKSVMIGDSVSDYKSAMISGIPFIGAAYGYTPREIEQLPSVGNAYSPDEILKYL